MAIKKFDKFIDSNAEISIYIDKEEIRIFSVF